MSLSKKDNGFIQKRWWFYTWKWGWYSWVLYVIDLDMPDNNKGISKVISEDSMALVAEVLECETGCLMDADRHMTFVEFSLTLQS